MVSLQAGVGGHGLGGVGRGAPAAGQVCHHTPYSRTPYPLTPYTLPPTPCPLFPSLYRVTPTTSSWIFFLEPRTSLLHPLKPYYLRTLTS